MTKFTKEKLYTELSIKIATLDMKLDAILKLLNKPEVEYEIDQQIRIMGARPGHGASWSGVIDTETFDREFK
jgi:hypothetical protein